jgi:hypothetical protein
MAQPGYKTATLQIDNGESLSDESVCLKWGAPQGGPGTGWGTLVAIVVPASWTAADLTFQASNDDTTFTNLYNASGTEVTVTAAASRWIALDPSDFAGIAYLKVRSGTAAAAVNQGGDRVVTFVIRPV